MSCQIELKLGVSWGFVAVLKLTKERRATLAREKIRVLDGTASSCWRFWESAQAFFRGNRGTNPSTEGWHILKAFCMLSSNVRPTAITWRQNNRRLATGTEGLFIFSRPPLQHFSWNCRFHGTCPGSGRGPNGGSWWRCNLSWVRSRPWSSEIQRSWSLAGGCPAPI